MNPYLSQLDHYLQTCQQRGGINSIESVLEFLWQCYSAGMPVDDGRVRSCEDALRPYMEALPFDPSNALFDSIADLCTAYQHAAFLEGLALGARIHAELTCAP